MSRGAILCVTRNNLHLSKRAINSALDQHVPCDVMVIDNASTDGTVDWLKTKPISKYVSGVQLSLSACWNRGIKAFFNLQYSEVLVINNDIELRPDTYGLLAQCAKDFVTCVSVNTQDQLGQDGDRDLDTLLRSWRAHPDFSCFMIRRKVVDEVGWFDEGYFPAYCEDCQYHVRMHRAGIQAGCVALPFLHLGAQTVSNASAAERARIQRYAGVNREKFRREFGCYPGTPEYEALFGV